MRAGAPPIVPLMTQAVRAPDRWRRRRQARVARLANFGSIYFAYLHLISNPRAAERRVCGPAWRAFLIRDKHEHTHMLLVLSCQCLGVHSVRVVSRI
jgi:hypothetical protein